MAENNVYWYRDHIVLIQFNDETNWNDFHRCVRAAHELAATVDHEVSIVVRTGIGMPTGNPMVNFRKVFDSQPKNVRQLVIVAEKQNSALQAFLKRLAMVIQKLIPSSSTVVFVSSLEEAEGILAPQ